MLSWSEYLKQGTARPTAPDKGRISALLKLADARIEAISRIELNEQNSSVIFTNYYDALREVCEALALSNGWKIYLHEAIGLFLREVLKENIIFAKFDRYRLLRNGVNYYGRLVPLCETSQAIRDIKEVIGVLKRKYLKEFI